MAGDRTAAGRPPAQSAPPSARASLRGTRPFGPSR